MELSELETQVITPIAIDKDKYDEDEQTLADLIEGISLLATARTLLDYLANVELCSAVSKRERVVMQRLSEKIREHLSEVEPTYIIGD